ncbi:MAG: hypothetical protein GXO69_10265 [Acidobacteria bacterium]|nr:hypothetical protein [Acidobacteriota bacterium]
MVKFFYKNQIRTDDRFRFHRGDVPGNLVRSVEREGILLPLIAVAGEQPLLVDGYRRFDLLSEGDSVPVRQMRDEDAAVRAAVELNMLASPYSEMEKAGIVAVVHENAWMPEREILDKLLPRLGLKGCQSVLENCINVVDGLSSVLLNVLMAKKAPLKFAARLAGEFPEEQAALAGFFSGRRFSLSQMIQAYDLLVPIRKRDGATISVIIEKLKETKGDVIDALQRMRFPKTTGIRMKLGALLLPYREKLSFPPDFEGDAFRFSCRLKSPEQAVDCARLLHEISQDSSLFRFLSEYLDND